MMARRAAREASGSIATEYPADLPISERREEIIEAIRANQVIVLCGETGSGKTTQLPKMCMDAGLGIEGMIGHTQPRRIAARSVAKRIALELNTALGDVVGFKIRFADSTSDACRIKVMTDGMLLTEMTHDRDLLQYDAIILDEAHERSLNIDFIIGYIKRLLPRRPDLKIIITSATIDPQRFSEHFDDAPIIEVSGRTYPVEVRYRALVSEDPDNGDRDMAQGILHALHELQNERLDPRGSDTLVFLPGEREIRQAHKALRGLEQQGMEVLPLYARLSTEAQDRVFQSHHGRRVVLATNVAETSLTVPRIGAVIDTGVARVSRYSARRNVQMLPVEAISQASANQRAGRCGRVAEGICIRLYAENDYEQRPEFTEPEIQRTNLASVILQMRAMGLGRVEDFPFLDPPRRGMIREGHNTLRELGAIDDHDRITAIGRKLARMPVDPRIGRMILAADRENALREVLIIAAGLSVQDPRERSGEQQQSADAAHEQFADDQSDFNAMLNIWRFYHDQKDRLTWRKVRRACEQHHLSFVRMREWTDVHRQLRDLAMNMNLTLNRDPAHHDSVHRALLSGLLSHIARKAEGHRYEGAGGKELYIFPGSSQFDHKPEWIVAAELVETTRPYARMVAQVQPDWIEQAGRHLLKRSYSNPRFEARSGRVMADERIGIFGLELVGKRAAHYGPVDPETSRSIFIRQALVEQKWTTNARFMKHNRGIIAEIEAIQAKRRKRDVLVDDDVQVAFYEARLPADAYATRRFDHWRKQAERDKPRLLFMTRDDLMQQRAVDVTEGDFPEFILVDGTPCSLTYVLQPGEEADGVTITLHAELLTHLSGSRIEWLVPGFLHEKITALLRTLPKDIRRKLVPAPDWARAICDRIEFGNGALRDQLAGMILELSGVDVKIDDFSPAEVPPHLRMNMRVIDQQNRILAEGRDLDALKGSTQQQVRQTIEELAAEQFNQSGVTVWSFGRLTETVELRGHDDNVTAYPVLFDAYDSVSLQATEDRIRARSETHRGLCRLMLIALRGEVKAQIDMLPDASTIAMQWNSQGIENDWRDELSLRIVERACLGDQVDPDTVRSSARFEECVNAGFGAICREALAAGSLLASILDEAHELAIALDRDMPAQWQVSVGDIARRRDGLLTSRFFFRSPWIWLEQMPRYLTSLRARLEKLARGGWERDAKVMAEFRPFQQQLDDLLKRDSLALERDPQAMAYRWMLEELHIAMFTQDVGTALPVSAKRMREQWQRIVSGGHAG